MKTSAPSASRTLAVLLTLVFGLALWFSTRGWERPILDRHEFRQLQTAVSAFWIREAGYRLDYETPLFGPPWSLPMEFPIYQIVVGNLSRALGTELEPTGRAVSLLFLLATLPAVYGLAGLLVPQRALRLMVTAVVWFAPIYLFYSRTFLVETTALCGSIWFLFAVARSAQERRWRWAALAALAGTLAALAKVTTFLIYLPPAALAWWWLDRAWSQTSIRWWQRVVPIVAAAGIALAFGAWWVRHADEVKQANPFTGFLTSAELVKWNWGTLDQRLSVEFWAQLWRNVSAFLVGEIALVPLIVGFVVAAPLRRVVALGCVGSFLAATLLFSNLFHRHDYYYCANAVLLLFAAGLLLASLWECEQLPRAVRTVLLVVFFGAQLLIFHRGYADYLRREPTPPPGLADVVRTTTPKEGVILIYGWDWNSLVPYYAQRRVVMVPGGREAEPDVLEEILQRLPPREIVAMIVQTPPLREAPTFIRERVARFKLAPAPVARSDAGDLYLSEELAATASLKLAGRSFRGVALNLGPTEETPFAANQPVNQATVALAIFEPRPQTARTLYGMSAGELDGRTVLHAHAPAELELRPPAGADAISASFGLPDAAWRDGPSFTDGIGVEIFERLPSGARRQLLQRTIDPFHTPADRGLQKIELNGIGPFTGTLVFRFTTGPKDNSTNDWAYWGGITVR